MSARAVQPVDDEHLFRTLADSMPQLVWMADADGNIHWYNSRWYEYTGTTLAQMEGWGWQRVHDPRELPDVIARWKASLATGEPFEMVFPLRGRDGAYRPFLTRVVPAKDQEGRVLRWFGTNTDISEQYRTETLLRESDRRLQLALSAGRGIGTWDWDVRNDRVVADERFAGLYGVDVALAAAGAPMACFFGRMHPDDVDRVTQGINAALEAGTLFSEQYRLVQPDGVRWVLAEGRCEMGPDGLPSRFPGVSFDITDRKQAEQSLRELNADLERQVIERAQGRAKTWAVSPDLLGALNADGYFETSNPAWETILGWTPAEVASMSIFDLLHPDDVDRTRAVFELTQIGQPALRFPNRYRCKDGTYRWISWTGVPDDGMVYCIGRDITEETERADALQMAESALRQSQKMEAVGQLTGGLAHDFNNLLAGIGGSLEVIGMRMREGRVDAIDRYLQAAQGAVKRAAALTHRLLAFSRRQTLDPMPTDVNRLIHGIEELVRRTVGPAVELHVVATDELWPALVDPNQLENALLNLCINARDAMPEGSRLTIETTNHVLDARGAKERDLQPGDYLSLCVIDTGVGMTDEIAGKAFEPFFTTKPLGEGTGLGLSMVYGFARQSGGRIESEVGKGTTLCVYLPRHDQAAVDELRDAVQVRTTDEGTGEVVLVIDDEPTVRMVIAEVLSAAGYATIEAVDGPSALPILQVEPRIDLLITDVGLPGGMNGRQVADAARVARPGLKVLFITGYAETAAIGKSRLEEGMTVITKPFAIDDLARKVRELMRE